MKAYFYSLPKVYPPFFFFLILWYSLSLLHMLRM